MAQELITRTWCDSCLEEGTHTAAEPVEVEVVLPGERRTKYTADLCQGHRGPVVALVELLETVGRKTKRSGRPSGQKAATEPEADERVACPECGKWSKNRHALASHMRRFHEEAVTPTTEVPTCPVPECEGKTFSGPQGFGSHLRRVHDLSVAEALALKAS